MFTIEHNHPSEEGCDENSCDADRYLDGKHVFTDVDVITVDEEGAVLVIQVVNRK